MRTSDDPRYDAAKRTEAARLYATGLSVRAVADTMGVSLTRAWEFLQDADVKMRPPGRGPHHDPDVQHQPKESA